MRITRGTNGDTPTTVLRGSGFSSLMALAVKKQLKIIDTLRFAEGKA